jgi:hypothetical protein
VPGADDARVRFVLALLVVAGCTPGLAPSIARAHDEVIAEYRSVMRPAVDPNVEYLGEGCYIVGDRLGHGMGYGCITDPHAPNGRKCIPTAGDGTVVFERSCRMRVDPIFSDSGCTEVHAPAHCKRRVIRHDRRHGRGTCTVRIRASGGVDADLPLELNARAMLELKHELGKRWSGTGPLVFSAQSCRFPVRSGRRYTPSQELDELIARALAKPPNRCGLTTVQVTGWQSCVF